MRKMKAKLAAVLAAALSGPVLAVDHFCGIPVVAEEDVACPLEYRGEQWSYPADLDERYGQRAADGSLFSPYDGLTYPNAEAVDIEHLRSRHSAHKGGGCAWGLATKRAYARDPLNITVAPPRLNRVDKRDKDPDEWMPEVGREWFAWRYLAVSRKYGLSITPQTRDALEEVIGGRCP